METPVIERNIITHNVDSNNSISFVNKLISGYDQEIKRKSEEISYTIRSITITMKKNQGSKIDKSQIEKLKQKSISDIDQINSITRKKNAVQEWVTISKLNQIISDHSKEFNDYQDNKQTEKKIFKSIFFDLISKNTKNIYHSLGKCQNCDREKDIYLDTDIMSKTVCGKKISDRNLTPCICDLNCQGYPLCKQCLYEKLYILLVDAITLKIDSKDNNDSFNCIVVCPQCKGHFCPFSLRCLKIVDTFNETNDEVLTDKIVSEEYNNLNNPNDTNTDDLERLLQLMQHEKPNNLENTVDFNHQNYYNGPYQQALSLFDNISMSDSNITISNNTQDDYFVSLPADQLQVNNDGLVTTDLQDRMILTTREERIVDTIVQKVEKITNEMFEKISEKLGNVFFSNTAQRIESKLNIKPIHMTEKKCTLCKMPGHYAKSHNNPRHKINQKTNNNTRGYLNL